MYKRINKFMEFFLVVIFVMYLMLGHRLPANIATVIDTPISKIIITVLSIMLFAHSNPLLGILGIIVAFHIIQNSRAVTGSSALEKYYPTEVKKWSPFTPIHQFPYTLEQEMVKKMASQKFNDSYEKASYRPVLDNTHDAIPLAQFK
jgi:hypothetical protein